MEGRQPLFLFLVAVIAAALYGGLGPGLAATGLSAAVGSLAYLEPVGSFRIDRPRDRIRLGLFLLEARR